VKKQNALLKLILLCIVAGLFIMGCGKNNPVNVVPPEAALSDGRAFVRTQNDWITNTGFSQLSLSQSYQKWLDYKAAQGNTYVYYSSFASWTGFRTAFQVLVYHGSIARIIMTQTYINSGTGIVDTTAQREIPTDSANFWEILNVDDMYKYAQDSVITKNTDSNTIYLELFENGLLKSCKYRPINCIDDCLFGVSIDALFFGEIKDK
jgi:hypothetical protein